jgi:hypothetical protein
MAWSRIDDSLHSHPKIMQVGNAATGLFVRLISYSSQHLTDGFVPATVARTYGTPRLLGALCDASLLVKIDAKSNQTSESHPHFHGPGYVIHDYLDYNPSREQVLMERAKNAARQEAFRNRKRGKPVPPDGAGTPPDNGQSNGVTHGVSNTAPTRPDPTPTSGTEREEGDRSQAAGHEALSLVPENWQPDSGTIAAAQSARTAAGRPVLTGAQLQELTRKFVRKQRNSGWLTTPAAAAGRWIDWAERERPADTQQPPLLLGLPGGQPGPAWPHEQAQQRAQSRDETWTPPSWSDQLAQIEAQIAADNARDTG